MWSIKKLAPMHERSLSCVKSSKGRESPELARGRKEFEQKMGRLKELEQSSMLDFINRRAQSCAKELQIPTVRAMPLDHTEKLLGFMRKRRPEIRRLNLSDLSHDRELQDLNNNPTGCYITETKVRYGAQAMFGKRSYLWQMCKDLPLGEAQRKRLVRLARTPSRKTTYQLTQKFLEKNFEDHPREEYIEASAFVKKKAESQERTAVRQQIYSAEIVPVEIGILPTVIGGHVFCFGHKAMLFPCSSSRDLAVVDLCTESGRYSSI